MGALKEIWINPNLNTYNKYLVFRAMPMNLLLWGCELTWQTRSLLTQKHGLMNIRPKTMAQQSWNMWNDRARPKSITTHPCPRIGCIQNRSKNKVQTTISNKDTTELTAEEASEFFKLLNNANEYLKERLWWNRNRKLELEFEIELFVLLSQLLLLVLYHQYSQLE